MQDLNVNFSQKIWSFSGFYPHQVFLEKMGAERPLWVGNGSLQGEECRRGSFSPEGSLRSTDRTVWRLQLRGCILPWTEGQELRLELLLQSETSQLSFLDIKLRGKAETAGLMSSEGLNLLEEKKKAP